VVLLIQQKKGDLGMKICNEVGRKLSFMEVYDGDVFIFEHDYYIKMSPIRCDHVTIFNAVGLAEGEPYLFSDETKVFLVDAELRIKS
jgi:hypothetical protein